MAESRRLYFDDGTSRKRWQITVTGKTQTTRYGKLWGSLRESEKSFESPAEAKRNSEKLIAKKIRQGYREVDPARLEIVRDKGRRRATDHQIKALERQIGTKLPKGYRDFLKTVNGGRPNPRFINVPGAAGIDNVGVGQLFHLQPAKEHYSELTYQIQAMGRLLPAGHLPIGGDSDVFTLSLHDKTFGCVFWWFHECNLEHLDDDGNFLESAGHLLASSFDEFLTRIALVIDEDDEQELEVSPNRGGKPKPTIRTLLSLLKHDHTATKIKAIEKTAKQIGDLSGIQNGEWPFINISDARVLRCLLHANLNPEITDAEGHTLLWQCASSKECIDLLAKQGVDIDRRGGSPRETALMRAIFLEIIPAVKRLVQLGANPTLRMGSHINTKIKFNAKLKRVVDKAKADWSKKSAKKPRSAREKESTPKARKKNTMKKADRGVLLKRFLRLIKHDHIYEAEVIGGLEELVVELGDLSGVKNGQWPAIQQFENPQLLRFLLEHGLSANITDKRGNSLVSQCVTHPECIELLAGHGADLNHPAKDGETPLMRASWVGEQDCVQALLDAGADPTPEFVGAAKVFLDMDEEMLELIEDARAKWKKRKRKKK